MKKRRRHVICKLCCSSGELETTGHNLHFKVATGCVAIATIAEVAWANFDWTVKINFVPLSTPFLGTLQFPPCHSTMPVTDICIHGYASLRGTFLR